MSVVREIRDVRAVREERMARRLTLMAVALFVLNSAVLALGAQAYGWAAALLATAAVVALTTGALGRTPGTSATQQTPGPGPRPVVHAGQTADALH